MDSKKNIDKICTEDGCTRKFLARGRCRLHYVRWKAANETKKATCGGCGEEFDHPKRGGTRKFCTKECMKAHKKNPPTKTRFIDNCANCGKEFENTPCKVKRGKTTCSAACRTEKRRKDTVAKSKGPCKLCGKKEVIAKGMCNACYQKHLIEIHKKNTPPDRTCEECGEPFWSRSNAKRFCSLDCYINSDFYKEHMAEAQKKSAELRGVEIGKRVTLCCDNCEAPFEVLPSEAKGKPQITNGMKRVYRKRFCTKTCYRKWFAERYDRWIANPETIALPQAYDEFLTKEHLPCLVEGCGWEGDNLSNHMNFSHGVIAEEFKAMAGFNKSTGLITETTRKKIEESREGQEWGNANIGEIPKNNREHLTLPRGKLRPEGIEHMRKSRNELSIQTAESRARAKKKRDSEWVRDNTKPCIVCSEPSLPNLKWRAVKKTCSKKCARKHLSNIRSSKV